ncbi:MAG: hypothetical protein IKO16_09295 [Lachnospiraceae bacterium]|nr:hypothetical protein [Lachnospiraceae bacterium]
MFDSKELDLKGMLMHVALKWRIILVVMILFAVLLPYIAAKRGGTLLPENSGQDEKTKSELVDVKMASVRTLADYYKEYDDTDRKIKQNEELRLNPDGYKAVYIQYHIIVNSDKKEAQDISPILTAYRLYYTGTEFVNALLEATGSGIDPALYTSFITITVENNDFIIKVPCRDDMDSAVLTRKVMDLTQSEYERLHQQFAHRIDAVGEGISEGKNADIAKEQKSLVSSKADTNKQIKSVIKDMSKKQIQYARDLADGKLSENELESKLIADEAEENRKNEPDGIGKTSIVLFAVAGAIIGMIFMIFVLCEMYIFSGRLHSTKELTKNANLFIAGVIEQPEKNRQGIIESKIRTWFRGKKKQFDLEHQLDNVATSVCLLCGRNEIARILLTSSLYDRINKEFINRLVSAISSQGIEAAFVDGILDNKDALLECSKNGNILLIEQIGRSALSDIESEILSANGYGIRILGTIVIE